MTRPAPIVLLTRPDRQARAFAAELTRLDAGLGVVISPVLSIEPRVVRCDLDRYDGLIFTSQNAVRAAAGLGLAGRRAYCVGARTADLARNLGAEARALGRDAQALIAALRARPPSGRLLFLRGEHSRGDVEKALNSAGIETDSLIIYDQRARPLNTAARDALAGDGPVILPLFSPRSAAILGQEIGGMAHRAPLGLVAISRAALEGWSGPDPALSVVAARPDAQAMSDEILRRISQWS